MQKSLFPDRFRILSGSMLKLIAVISMLIDHSALILVPALPILGFTLPGTDWTLYFILRKLGRLAFPIYCFLIGEGLAHTGNRKGYLLRLLIFAVLSEVPFDLMVRDSLFHFAGQNVFFTLLLGAMLICMFESAKPELVKAIGMFAVLVAAGLLNVDYGVLGVVLILVIYLLRSHPAAQAIVSYPLLTGGIAAFSAFLPINLYNGKRGFIRGGFLKYCFYIFYPAHMLLLLLLRYLITQ